MKKVLIAICFLMFSSIAFAFQHGSTFSEGEEIILSGYKYHYFPISYSSATAIKVGGDANELTCSGLGAGADEVGSTAGYVQLKEATDRLRFRFRLPQTFVDTGIPADLKIQFHVEEQGTSDAMTFNVNIYEYGSTTAILSDTFTIFNGDSKQWYDLDTNSSGIGSDSDIDSDDVLVIVINPEVNDYFDIGDFYAVRLKYRVGIEATQ